MRLRQLTTTVGLVLAVAAVSTVPTVANAAAVDGTNRALVHQWKVDSECRGRTPDSVGRRTGLLQGGATLVPGRVGNAVQVDGVGGYVSTTGSDIRTDSGFTVAAWVYLTAKPFGQVTAVSIDGDHASNFRLSHIVDNDQRVQGKWVFDMPVSDTDGAIVQADATAVVPAPLNTWVHLVGVHDATTHRLWLYVEGARVAGGSLDTPWQASGGVQIGRARVDGGPAQFWPGRVDDVRIYNAALTADEISALRRSYDPALNSGR